jgi:hypothetical protein
MPGHGLCCAIIWHGMSNSNMAAMSSFTVVCIFGSYLMGNVITKREPPM